MEAQVGHPNSSIYGTSFPLAANEAAMPGSSADLRQQGKSHFDIYRVDQVRLTAMLFGGGDWHWRLTDHAGTILADCGGYRNQRDCLAAVEALRAEAWRATVTKKWGCFYGEADNLQDIHSE